MTSLSSVNGETIQTYWICCNTFVLDFRLFMLGFHQQYQCKELFRFSYLKGPYKKAEWRSGSVLGP